FQHHLDAKVLGLATQHNAQAGLGPKVSLSAIVHNAREPVKGFLTAETLYPPANEFHPALVHDAFLELKQEGKFGSSLHIQRDVSAKVQTFTVKQGVQL